MTPSHPHSVGDGAKELEFGGALAGVEEMPFHWLTILALHGDGKFCHRAAWTSRLAKPVVGAVSRC